jgi:hypothetical protein
VIGVVRRSSGNSEIAAHTPCASNEPAAFARASPRGPAKPPRTCTSAAGPRSAPSGGSPASAARSADRSVLPPPPQMLDPDPARRAGTRARASAAD